MRVHSYVQGVLGWIGWGGCLVSRGCLRRWTKIEKTWGQTCVCYDRGALLSATLPYGSKCKHSTFTSNRSKWITLDRSKWTTQPSPMSKWITLGWNEQHLGMKTVHLNTYHTTEPRVVQTCSAGCSLYTLRWVLVLIVSNAGSVSLYTSLIFSNMQTR